jgi:hypothetical protein
MAEMPNRLPKWKRSLQFRGLDPALSECHASVPESWRRLEGATSWRIFLPSTPTGDWVRSIGSSVLINEQSY